MLFHLDSRDNIFLTRIDRRWIALLLISTTIVGVAYYLSPQWHAISKLYYNPLRFIYWVIKSLIGNWMYLYGCAVCVRGMPLFFHFFGALAGLFSTFLWFRAFRSTLLGWIISAELFLLIFFFLPHVLYPLFYLYRLIFRGVWPLYCCE